MEILTTNTAQCDRYKMIQIAYVRAALPPARWGSAAGFIIGGVIAAASAAGFLRVGWRVYTERRGNAEEEED